MIQIESGGNKNIFEITCRYSQIMQDILLLPKHGCLTWFVNICKLFQIFFDTPVSNWGRLASSKPESIIFHVSHYTYYMGSVKQAI